MEKQAGFRRVIVKFYLLLFVAVLAVQNGIASHATGSSVTKSASLAEHRESILPIDQALSYPTDPTADIPWSGGTSTVAHIQAAFNNARTVENSQLGTSIPMMTLPSQTEWNNMSDGEKALWLINRERIDRGVAPLQGLEVNVGSVAQYYADYLLDNNTWGHTADGRTPWQRLNDNPAIGACHDFLSVAENIFVFVTSGSSISLPLERAIYGWMYEDGPCCNWGHRHAILWYPYNDNSGTVGSEGFLGIGRANGGPYQGPFDQPWNFAEMIVMNVFDPCASWNDTPPVVNSITRIDPNPTSSSSVKYNITFSENVTGVGTDDFTLTTTGGISGAAVSTVTGSGSTRTVTVNTGSGIGTLRLNVADNDSILDGSGNPLGGSGSGNGDYTSGEIYNIVSPNTNVFIAGALMDDYFVPSQGSLRVSFPGVDAGPVQVASINSTNILSALRVIWKEPGYRSSYSEMMGLPVEQLSTEYWFPWYNNAVPASMDQGFRIGNVNATSTAIEVWVGTTKLDTLSLNPGASTRVGYNVDNGPIRIVCTDCSGSEKIIAALRVIWREPGLRYSYSEMMGLPVEQLSTEYWFPWYNNAVPNSMDQGFRIANVSSSETNTVEVWVGTMKLDTLSLNPGASMRVGYNVDNGPIRIVCTTCTNTGDDKIIAALRVIWKEPGFRASYSEMMGLPKEQLSDGYWFPWYNNAVPASMDQGFRIANVSLTESNTVEVWVGNTLLDTISLPAGASTRVGYNVDNGPIRILCTTCTNTDGDQILAALRVIWKEPGFRASYSEMMGLPAQALSTEYWFPWYNFAAPNSMDQGFRIAVP
jgi:uncharacterized protein YkwD